MSFTPKRLKVVSADSVSCIKTLIWSLTYSVNLLSHSTMNSVKHYIDAEQQVVLLHETSYIQ